jgi:hypothetical protein
MFGSPQGGPEDVSFFEQVLAAIMREGGVGNPMSNALMVDPRYSDVEKYGKLLQGNVMPYEDIPSLDEINAMIEAQGGQPASPELPDEGLLQTVMQLLQGNADRTGEALQY